MTFFDSVDILEEIEHGTIVRHSFIISALSFSIKSHLSYFSFADVSLNMTIRDGILYTGYII